MDVDSVAVAAAAAVVVVVAEYRVVPLKRLWHSSAAAAAAIVAELLGNSLAFYRLKLMKEARVGLRVDSFYSQAWQEDKAEKY